MKVRFWATAPFKQFYLLIIGFFTFCLASCSDFVSGYVYEKAELLAAGGSRYVYISLDSGDESRSSRTITASSVDFTDKNKDYRFYIWGKSNVSSLAPRTVNFSADSSYTGTIELDFPISTYNFTLAVTDGEPSDSSKDSTILKEAIFVGYANVDLSYTTQVKFYLSDTDIASTGTVDLKLLLDESWTDEQVADLNENYTVTFGLYYIKSGAGVEGAADINAATGFLSKTTPFLTSIYYSSVAAGNYNFIVTFKKSGGKKYSYSDRLIVAANRSVDASVYIPNVIERVPDAPQNFKAAWSMDSLLYYGEYDSASSSSGRLSENTDIDEYNVDGYGLLLKWDDMSNNETGFRIMLADITKIKSTEADVKSAIAALPDAMTDSAWQTLVGSSETNSEYVRVFDEDCAGSEEYIGGSCGRNSSQLILFVPFGSCYVAKIQAVNDEGVSEACYATFGDALSVLDENDKDYTTTGVRYNGNAFTAGTETSKVINLYKTVYFLNGGTEYYYAGDTLKAGTPEYLIRYRTYGDGGIMVSAETKAEGTIDAPYIYCTATGSRWTHWTRDALNGKRLSEFVDAELISIDEGTSYEKYADYEGYASLYLFAHYQTDPAYSD